jgi:hypothetical protein
MEVKKIKGLIVKPYELPEEIEIENTLEAKQKLVEGSIECVYYKDVILICNEEGKINGMRPNRDIGSDIIFGPFLIVGDDYDNASFKSLTDKQILDNKIRFDENSIIRTENKILCILHDKNKEYER